MGRLRNWILALIVFAAPILGACAETGLGAPPSVEEVYRRAGESLNRPGSLYHMIIETQQDAGEFSYQGTTEQWIDASQDVARTEYRLTFKGQTTRGKAFTETAIIRADGRYVRDSDGEVRALPPPICHGASVAASTVLGCPSFSGRSSATVERGDYQGRPAIVLVTTDDVHGSDERTNSTRRVYLDPDTFLPIASEQQGTIDYGPTVPLHARSTYQSAFIATGTVSPDFFVLASIDWQGVMAPLDQAQNLGVTPYWLGDRFDPGGGLPTIVPSNVDVLKRYSNIPSYAFSLTYGLEDNRFGRPLLTMWEWPRSDWEAGSGPSNQAALNVHYPCHQLEEISLPGGQAKIAKMHKSPQALAEPGTPQHCPDRPFDLFSAEVILGDTVVFIKASDTGIHHETPGRPYNSLEGMRAVVHGLRLR